MYICVNIYKYIINIFISGSKSWSRNIAIPAQSLERVIHDGSKLHVLSEMLLIA